MSKQWEQRFAALDIECTALRTTYGRTLCVCVKFFDEAKVREFVAYRPEDEAEMLYDLSETYRELEDCGGILVTFNGKLFDMPYLNGRLIQKGMTTLRNIKHMDLLYQARKFKFVSARLVCVQQNLDLPSAKFDVHPDHWIKANAGNKKSMDLILKHCRFDVKMTQELYGRMAPMIASIHR